MQEYDKSIEFDNGLDNIWQEMITLAENNLFDWQINDFIDAGGVSACIRTANGNYYIGVCFDTSASIGMCAERAAIAQMITNHENIIDRIVCLNNSGNCLPPCGVCREIIKQLSPQENGSALFLKDFFGDVYTLDELLPNWWGYSHNNW